MRRSGRDLGRGTGAGEVSDAGAITRGGDTGAGDGSERAGTDAGDAIGTLGRMTGVSTGRAGTAGGLLGGGWIARRRISATLA